MRNVTLTVAFVALSAACGSDNNGNGGSGSGPGSRSITGKVVDTAGAARAGLTVTAVGTNPAVTTTTGADGTYTLSGLGDGSYFVETSPSADKKWLAGGTRTSVVVSATTTAAAPDIVVSARPSDAATYVGGVTCQGCHLSVSADIVNATKASAHWRSLTTPVTNPSAPLSRLLTTPGKGNTLWPASTGAGNKLSFTTLCADGVTDECDVYACNLGGGTAAKAYGFKFVKPADKASPNASDCTVTTNGDVVPISGTYGGEGDRYIAPGTTAELKNAGVFKQRFFAALADVPATKGWTDYPAAEQGRDWIVMPVQINQSGGQKDPSGAVVQGGPRFAPYGALQHSWSERGETFAQQCASCHNVGTKLVFNADRDVIAYDYRDFNMTCEQCHGPGSEHVANPGKAKGIMNPRGMTAHDEIQVCGRCHDDDAATMTVPFGAGEMPWNQDRVSTLGNGLFLAGIHDIRDYIANYDGEVTKDGITLEPGFVTWPDGKHGRPHRQQGAELLKSGHMNNTVQLVTCLDCHSQHSLFQGPVSAKATDPSSKATYDLHGTKFHDNSVCLRCHAAYGPFTAITTDDVGALVTSGGGQAFVNGSTTAKAYSAAEVDAAKQRISQAVIQHMGDKVPGMGSVPYQPENEDLPLGRCASCHMAKTGQSGGSWFVQNTAGERAKLEGDEASHAFDVVKPADSQATATAAQAQPKPTTGQDTRWQNVMPNACAACHDSMRFYIK
jgi:hypothetical protein